MDFSMKQIWKLLEIAALLQSIKIPVVVIDGSEPEELPGWASQSLHKMSLGLCLQGHGRDLERGVSSPQPETERQFAEASSKSATRLRPLLMAQINAQSGLRELELGFNHCRRLRRSPFLDLSLDPVIGFPQLSSLERLERLWCLDYRVAWERRRWLGST